MDRTRLTKKREDALRQRQADPLEGEVMPSTTGTAPASGHDFSRTSVLPPAASAQQALEKAAESNGLPIPDGPREAFERSLDADLSGVRLHTGGASAEAAEAIGARAYTLGQDIHFGPGSFNPAGREGLAVLAHEVAHTQQQRGASSVAADRLPILPPAHPAESEATRAAGLMVHGAPASVGQSVGGGVQRLSKDDVLGAAQDLAGALGIPVPLTPKPFDKGVGDAPAQAIVKGGANSDVKVAYDGATPAGPGEGWAHSKEPDSQSKSLTIDRGRSGTVSINIHTWWHTEGITPQKLGESDSRISARFSCDEDGVVTVSGAVPQTGGGGDVVEAFTDGTGADGARLFGTGGVKQVLSASEAASRSQERSSGASNSGSKETGVSGGIKVVDIEGKQGSSFGHEKKEGESRGNTTTVNTAGANRVAFNREVSLVAGPRKPAPAALSVDSFSINHSHLPPHGTNTLIGWWAGLDPDTQAAIRNGSMGIRLTGFADKPGTEEHNLNLSNDRAKSVQKALEKIIGGGVVTTLEGFGSAQATLPGYDPTMRKVDLTVFNKKKA